MPREVRRCGRGDSLPHAEAAWVGPGSTERTSGVGGEAGGKGHSEPLDTILLAMPTAWTPGFPSPPHRGCRLTSGASLAGMGTPRKGEKFNQ